MPAQRVGPRKILVNIDAGTTPEVGAPGHSRHGRYILDARVTFPYRGEEWRDRCRRQADGRLPDPPRHDPWPPVPGRLLDPQEHDHLAAWRLDSHGNPVGEPRQFFYDPSGTADHRHAFTRLLHWAKATGVQAITIEDLDFADSKTREKHGRKERFRQLVCGIPTGKLRAHLISMCADAGIGVIAVDPPAPATGAPSTGPSPSPPAPAGPPATRQQPWRSEGAPSDTGSGDGRHRPRTTKAIVRGIGRPRRGARSTAGRCSCGRCRGRAACGGWRASRRAGWARPRTSGRRGRPSCRGTARAG